MEENTKKMLSGQPYNPNTAELTRYLHLAHRLCRDYNLTDDDEQFERQTIIDRLFPHHQDGIYIQGPLHVDYGRFTTIGKNFYANFNLTILDICPIHIGDNVMCGPNVSLITAMHPLMYQQRNLRQQADGQLGNYEYGQPVTIGDNCWLASNVTVCPGVTIGNGCVIGAGTVVTKDIPDNSLVVGVPGKVIRKITKKDRLQDFPY